ncbi:SGNH/GDSL hydrolase family protein [Streptosporangium nondiastaticum]|uniref:SGNH/GDSL hydrolase family protein n=1 Tax=Streptosporangium nondiastaticum TaxID=35764 RepID=UPI0026B69FA1
MPGTPFPFSRYVALGDSQTEGVGDGDDVTGLRGRADRLTEHMARHNSGLLYADLAVRGRLAGQVHAEQLAPALALRPDLATVVAGVNDLLRPRFDADEVAGHLEAMFAALTARGTRVATLTFPDVARITPLARPVSHRVTALNHRIRQAAHRHGVAVAETGHHAVVTDPACGARTACTPAPRPPMHRRRRRPRPALPCPARQRRLLDPPPCPPPPPRRPPAGAPAPPNCAGPPTSSGLGSRAAYGAAPRATAARPSAHTSHPQVQGPPRRRDQRLPYSPARVPAVLGSG